MASQLQRLLDATDSLGQFKPDKVGLGIETVGHPSRQPKERSWSLSSFQYHLTMVSDLIFLGHLMKMGGGGWNCAKVILHLPLGRSHRVVLGHCCFSSWPLGEVPGIGWWWWWLFFKKIIAIATK